MKAARLLSSSAVIFALALVARSGRAEDAALARCIAASDSGLDLSKNGKLIEARKAFAECASTTCDAEIRTTCEQRIQELNDALPTVVFAPKDSAGNDLEGVTLAIDGALLPDRLNGNPIVVDPGEHEFRFDLAGRPTATKKLVVLQGEKNRRVEVVLEAAAPSPATPLPPAAPLAQTAAPPPLAPPAPTPPMAPAAPSRLTPGPVAPEPAAGNAQKSEATAWLGIGGAAIGVGLVLGGVTMATWHSAQTECKTACGPGSTAQKDKSTASTMATLSDVSVGLGGALIAVGVYRWLTAPSDARAQLVPVVGPQGAGLSFREIF